MAMNDAETVALIAGGHTFGKCHGAGDAEKHVGADPEAAPLQEMGFGWKNSLGTGHGVHTITSGLEGAWTENPARWDMNYLENLFNYEWELTTSPAGAKQWKPKGDTGAGKVPDAHDPNVRHAPMMLTTDLSLRFDPAYEKISRRFLENPAEFADAYARAWFKLTHRDLGPYVRGLGKLVPKEALPWQDPVPAVSHPLVGAKEIAALKEKVLASGLSVSELVYTAWSAAANFRGTDKRGGANGGRLRLEPQASWDVNQPAQLAKVLKTLEGVQKDFNGSNKAQISMADLIVLGGCAAVEKAAADAGFKVEVPFTPGRTDATQEMTDIEAMKVLEPTFDGFRNYIGKGHEQHAEELLVERACLLTLSAPEMTVLVGGMRALRANFDNSDLGVLTSQPGKLTNDFFVNILDMATTWSPTSAAEEVFEGKDRKSGQVKWKASRVDLAFGSNSELRALAEVYASNDAKEKFVKDFVAAWNKVMMLDRFELKN
jgi:catalase-peroxidase